MIKRLAALFILLIPNNLLAADWYISANSPIVSREIEGSQCRYLRVNASDSGYVPALHTNRIPTIQFNYDLNKEATGTGATIQLKSCTSATDTGTCADYMADINGDDINEAALLDQDLSFTATAPSKYLRGNITVEATGIGLSILKACGSTTILPFAEIDPIWRDVDTEAELEAHFGGLNIYTENDGPLGGGGGATNLGTNVFPEYIEVTSDTGSDATLPVATPTTAGVLGATDKTALDAAVSKLSGIENGATADQTGAEILAAWETETGRDVSVDGTKLDGIAAGATVGLGADPTACDPGMYVEDLNQTGVLTCSTPPGGTTNLSQGTRTGTTVNVDSSTGTSATLSAVDASNAGVMIATDKVKLDGIAAGATVGLGSDPAACGAGLVANDIAQDGTLGCVADNNVPDSGDFGNAAALEADGSLSADTVGIDEIDLVDGASLTDGYCLTYADPGTNGSLDLAPCGSGGGDSIRVEDGDNGGTFTAATDPDFEDSGDINFVLTPGSPDTITGLVRDDTIGAAELDEAADVTFNSVTTADPGDNQRVLTLGNNTTSIPEGGAGPPTECNLGFIGGVLTKFCNGGSQTSVESGSPLFSDVGAGDNANALTVSGSLTLNGGTIETNQFGGTVDAQGNSIFDLNTIASRATAMPEGNIWLVDTVAEWDAAVTACETHANQSGDADVGGRIIVTGWIERNCTGRTGTCFETPAVYRNNDPITDSLFSPCEIEFLNAGITNSGATNYATTTGLECQNTSTMTAEDGIKACLRVGSSGAKIVNANINTSTSPDASTVGIWIQSESDTCGPGNNETCAVVTTTLENVSVRSETIVTSGRGIAMAFALGADITVNDISGYSTAGIDFIDLGSYAFNNAVWIHGPGGIRTTAVGILCDSAYDSQEFTVGPMVLESNGRNISLDSNCTANVNVIDVYQEGCNSTTDPVGCPAPLFESTEGVYINNTWSHLNLSGTIGGSFADQSYGVRRMQSPTSLSQDDVIDVAFYSGTGVSYPASGGVILNGSYAQSSDLTLPDGNPQRFRVRTEAEITAALTACGQGLGSADAARGCEIILEGGIIDISQSITLAGVTVGTNGRSGVIFRGSGGYSTINGSGYANGGTTLRWTGGSDSVIDIGVCFGCELYGFSIDGADTATSAIEMIGGVPAKIHAHDMGIWGIAGTAILGNTTGQWDESSFHDMMIQYSNKAFHIRHNQSVGIDIGPNVIVTQMNGTGPFYDVEYGSVSIHDSYCGVVTNGSTCISFPSTANKLLVFNNQAEWAGNSGVKFIDADDALTGNTRRLDARNNHFVIDASSTSSVALDFYGRGTVEWVDNFFTANSGSEVPAVTIDAAAGQVLQVVATNNSRQNGTDPSDPWYPVVNDVARLNAGIIASDVLPTGDVQACIDGIIGIDVSNGTMQVCEAGAWIDPPNLHVADSLTGTVPVATVGADHVDDLTEIAQGIKTAADDTSKLAVYTGSLPGGTPECVQINSSGQLSTAGGACGIAGGEANVLDSPNLGAEIDLINSVPKTDVKLNLVSLEADDFSVAGNIITVDTGSTAGIQAWDADLDSVATNGTSAFGLDLLNDADASAGRTTLGLGSLAVKSALTATTDLDGALCGTNEILVDQGASWACVATPGGGGTNFDVQGDDGAPNVTITDGNVLQIVGGTNGIDTEDGDAGADTLTINFDPSEVGADAFTDSQIQDIALGGGTSGNFMQDVTLGAGIGGSHTPGEASTATITTASTETNFLTQTDTALTGVGQMRVPTTGTGLFYYDTAQRQIANLGEAQTFTGAKTFSGAGTLVIPVTDTATAARGQVRVSATGSGLFYYDSASRQVMNLGEAQTITAAKTLSSTGSIIMGTGATTGAALTGAGAIASNPAMPAGGVQVGSSGGLIFEGSSSDTIESWFQITNPTGTDKTFTFPDRSIDFTALTAADLGTDSVSADELNASGVASELEAALTLSNINGALSGGSGGKITDGTIDSNDLATDAVTLAKVADDAVGAAELDLIDTSATTDGFCLVSRPGGTGGTLEFITCPGGGGGTTINIDGAAVSSTLNFDDAGDINFTYDGDGTASTTVTDVPSGATVSIDETEIQLGQTDVLVGRDTTGAGAAEEITIGGGLVFTGGSGLSLNTLMADLADGSFSSTIQVDTGGTIAPINSGSIQATTVSTTTTTDNTASVAIFDSVGSGQQQPKTDGGLTYDATANALAVTGSITTPTVTNGTGTLTLGSGTVTNITLQSDGATVDEADLAIIADSVIAAGEMTVSVTDRLLGRDTTGSGAAEELTVGGGIEFTGTGIQRSALTGDVTASAGSGTTALATDVVGIAELDLIDTSAETDNFCLVARPGGTGGTLEFVTCPGGGSVTVSDAAGDTTTWPVLAANQTGTLSALSDAGLSYNANTDALAVSGSVTAGTVTDPADTGGIRLENAVAIAWEANPTGVDITMAADASSIIQITGGTLDGADISGTVPSATTASTATNFVSDPDDCGANTWATTIGINGNLTCSAVSGGAGITNDTVTTDDISDGADAPAEGEIVAVSATTTAVAYVKPAAICKTLFDSTGLTDTDDVQSIYRWSAPAVVSEVWCETDTGTATITVEDGAGNDLTTSCSCGTAGTSCTLTANTAFTDGELVDFVMATAAGNRLTFCMEYNYDL